MSAPSVCCLCLTADRQVFTDRAVRCFESQSYENCWMLIYDTGIEPYKLEGVHPLIVTMYRRGSRGHAIGALRNEAIELARNADIIAHWDSDDWSDANRVTAQVAELENSGNCWVTGLQNVLFLDTRAASQAWEYDCARSHHSVKVIGASLMYRREAWEIKQFDPHRSGGEDREWEKHQRVQRLQGVAPAPLLIAEVHGANSSGVYSVFDHHQPAFQPEWRRAPEWDSYCRERLYP
jgi:hypothetical protein